MKVKSLNCVRLFATPWIAAHQSPPSMGFSRQEYWSGVPLPSPVSCYSCLLPPVLHSAANAMIFKLYKVSLLLLFYLFLGFLFCIGVQLINNVVIVSGEQQRDSAVLMKVKVAPSCPALCDPMDCSLPGSAVHGILWARILEWVAIAFSNAGK